MLELYENIRKYRKRKKITQEKLATLTGYTDRSSIAKIEKGEVDLPQSKILLFANALGVDAGTLMGNVNTEKARPLIVEKTTTGAVFSSRFDSLSDHHQKEVLDYIDFLSAQEHKSDEARIIPKT